MPMTDAQHNLVYVQEELIDNTGATPVAVVGMIRNGDVPAYLRSRLPENLDDVLTADFMTYLANEEPGYLWCCELVAFPSPGHDTECSVCGTSFTTSA